MAKIQELYDRASGETIYPVSTTRAVICPNGSDLETRLTSEKQGIEARLGNVRAEEILTPGNFPDINILTREELKMDLFIDMFNSAAGDDGYARIVNGVFDCKLNEVQLTYEEALEVMRMAGAVLGARFYVGSNAKTNLPFFGEAGAAQSLDLRYAFFNAKDIEVIRFGEATYIAPQSFSIFNQCFNLRKIIGVLNFMSGTEVDPSTFIACYKLEDVQIALGASIKTISFRNSPLLSLASLQYLVINAANTSAVTVTVHSDVYAKLTDETNTEWNRVLIDAAAKNITFATI